MSEFLQLWTQQHLELLIVIAAILVGLSVAFLLALVLGTLTAPVNDEAEAYFERQRRVRLRQGNGTYRGLEVAVRGLSPFLKSNMPATVDKLDQTFPRARESLPWRGEEFLAVAMLEGSCVGALVYLMVGLFLDLWILGFLPAIAAVSLFTLLRVNALLSLAEIRRNSFRSRLPFAVDLLALMLEAGASLLQALQTIANEARGHPLGEELQTTLRLIDTGRPLRDALEDLLTRVDDPNLQELLQAIIHGDEMGAPMARVLSIQSEQMRLKRSQWGEKVAGEAQAQIIYPGLVIMVACIFIIAAPFVAQFLSNFN